jgi:hypothetical protein
MGHLFARVTLAITILLSPCSFASSVQSKVFSLFLKAVNDRIGGTLDAQTFEFRPPSSFIFEGVSLKDKSGRELLSAKSLKGTFSLSKLLIGTLSFDEIEAVSLVANLQIVNGDLDLVRLFDAGKPQKEKSQPRSPLSIKKVIVSDAHLSLKIENEFSLQLKNTSFEMSAFDTRLNALQFKRLSTFAKADTLPLALELLGTLNVSLDKREPESRVTFSGKVNNLSAYSVVVPNQTQMDAVIGFDHIPVPRND